MKAWVLVACSLLAFSFKLNADLGMFVDELGRARVFHGMNVVVKQPPYIPIIDHFDPQMSLCEEDLKNMQIWGFNLVRLGVMWVAVEPTEGQYNFTYLSEVKTLVQLLEKYDISVIIDMHQDLFNREFCGEGFPDWVIKYLDISHTCENTWIPEKYTYMEEC